MELFILVFLAVTIGSLGLFSLIAYLSAGGKSTIRKRFQEEFQTKQPGAMRQKLCLRISTS